MFRGEYVNTSGEHELFATNYMAGPNQKSQSILMFTVTLVLVSTTQ